MTEELRPPAEESAVVEHPGADTLALGDGRSHSDVEALKDGATLLMQAGNRVAALALLWSAVAVDPLDLGAHRRLAAMLANAGDLDGAANEYARYVEFLLPVGDVPRATLELSYGVRVVGGHPALRDAAEKIAAAVRAIVPAVEPTEKDTPELPAPRLLPKVPFRFCIHDAGGLRWLQLEGGTPELSPAAVRLVDADDNVVETRTCIALAPGQKGHAPLGEDDLPGVAWVVLGIPQDVAAALDAGRPSPLRLEAKVGDEWLSLDLADTACRLGRKEASTAVS
jgi:hypothetical protein